MGALGLWLQSSTYPRGDQSREGLSGEREYNGGGGHRQGYRRPGTSRLTTRRVDNRSHPVAGGGSAGPAGQKDTCSGGCEENLCSPSLHPPPLRGPRQGGSRAVGADGTCPSPRPASSLHPKPQPGPVSPALRGKGRKALNRCEIDIFTRTEPSSS